MDDDEKLFHLLIGLKDTILTSLHLQYLKMIREIIRFGSSSQLSQYLPIAATKRQIPESQQKI